MGNTDDAVRILLLEDSRFDRDLIQLTIQQHLDSKIHFEWVKDRPSFEKALRSFRPDIVLSDYNLPQFNGFEALSLAIEFDLMLPFIVVTGTLAEEVAADSIKRGAWDYVVKERLSRLPGAITQALKLKAERLAKRAVEMELKLRRDAESMQLKLLWDAVSSAPVSVVITGVDGTIHFVNPRFEQITGYSASEAVGKKPSILSSGFHDHDFYAAMWETILSGREWKGEILNRTKTNELIWEDISISPVTDHQGNIQYFVAIRSDITERKVYERELRESKQRYQNLVEDINDVLFELDTGQRIIYISPVVSKVTGYSPEEYIGHHFSEFLVPDDVGKVTGRLLELMQNATYFPLEYRIIRKDGSAVWVRSSSKPIIRKGEVIGTRGLIIDISHQKETEEELIKAKERAEAGNRLKTAFMNNISHEIRTPLNGILGFAPLLTDPAVPDKEKSNLLGLLEASSERLLQTVTDYMDISLIVSGNIELSPSLFVLGEITDALAGKFRKQFNERNIDFRVQISDELLELPLETDKEYLMKIFNHLIGNALKFTERGTVVLAGKQMKDEIRFDITDTGAGISDGAIPLIFESFMQEDSSNTRGYEGSGLGLAIVKGLVQLFGGTIHVTSGKGAGSTFTFTIPLTYVKHKKPVHGRSHNKIRKTARPVVLVVEDDPASMSYMQHLLKSKAELLLAQSGEVAVEQCRNHPEIDIVLMDIKMPGMSGIEATERIKKFRPVLPVIATTAYALPGDRDRCLRAGCDDYIAKPIRKDVFYSVLQKFGPLT